MARKSETKAKQSGNFVFPFEVGGKIIEHACTFNDHGVVCLEYGHLSTGTTGEGPWYCRKHFAMKMKWPADKTPQKSEKVEPIEEVDARVNKLVPRREGESEHDWSMRCKDWAMAKLRRLSAQGPKTFHDVGWATKILDRVAKGEVLPMISLQLAREVLSGRSERHPGDDEDQLSEPDEKKPTDRVLDDPGAFEGYAEFSTVQDPKSWDVDKDTGEIRNVEGDDECPV